MTATQTLTVTPSPTFQRDWTWVPPLEAHLDRVTTSLGAAHRASRRGQLAKAVELVDSADRLFEMTVAMVKRLPDGDPVNHRGRLLEQVEFIRQARATLITFA